jgi:hypothetical protein
MVSNADVAAWDKYYALEAAQAKMEQAAAAKRSAARAAARAAAAAEAGGGGSSISQQQEQQEEGLQQQQLEHEEELVPPSMPQQVFWTDGKTGGCHLCRSECICHRYLCCDSVAC